MREARFTQLGVPAQNKHQCAPEQDKPQDPRAIYHTQNTPAGLRRQNVHQKERIPRGAREAFKEATAERVPSVKDPQ